MSEKTSKNRLAAAVVAIAVVAAIAVGSWLAFGDKKEPVMPNNDQKTTKADDTLHRGTDGEVEFAINPDEIRVQVPQLGDETVSIKPTPGKQFVTVVVQAKNTTDKEKKLYASDQILRTKAGKAIKADAGMQSYIEDGSWYDKIPANGSASGTFVFEIGADDRIDSIELHGELDTKGVVIDLQ